MRAIRKRKRREHHDEHMDESWLLPYSDLLTLLLAAFLALLSASQIDAKKFELLKETFNETFTGAKGILENPSAVKPLSEHQTLEFTEELMDNLPSNSAMAAKAEKQRNLLDLKTSIDDYIKANNLTAQVNTQLNNSELMIVIRDHALFDSGSATVKPNSRSLAKALGEMLTKYSNYEVMVSGHTDNQPIRSATFPSNWDLSAQRSLNFMRLILENPSLNPSKFRSVGFGEYRPVDTNDTVEGRAKNRRVEVAIF